MSIENPLDLDAVLANIEQTYSIANEQFHERMAREAAESLMRDHCEELVEEVRHLRAMRTRIEALEPHDAQTEDGTWHIAVWDDDLRGAIKGSS